MQITEIRIKLMDDPSERLQAFCSITLDESFVIRDLKIIQGAKGAFVAMPSRKLTDRCPGCGFKNHLRACYCNQCGARLDEFRANDDAEGRTKLYADIAHPINSECREQVQNCVLEALQQEIRRSTEPDYVCRYDDFGEETFANLHLSQSVSEPTDALDPSDNGSGNESESDTHPAVAEHSGEPTRVDPPRRQVGPPHSIAKHHEESSSIQRSAHSDGFLDADEFGAGLE